MEFNQQYGNPHGFINHSLAGCDAFNMSQRSLDTGMGPDGLEQNIGCISPASGGSRTARKSSKRHDGSRSRRHLVSNKMLDLQESAKKGDAAFKMGIRYVRELKDHLTARSPQYLSRPISSLSPSANSPYCGSSFPGFWPPYSPESGSPCGSTTGVNSSFGHSPEFTTGNHNHQRPSRFPWDASPRSGSPLTNFWPPASPENSSPCGLTTEINRNFGCPPGYTTGNHSHQRSPNSYGDTPHDWYHHGNPAENIPLSPLARFRGCVPDSEDSELDYPSSSTSSRIPSPRMEQNPPEIFVMDMFSEPEVPNFSLHITGNQTIPADVCTTPVNASTSPVDSSGADRTPANICFNLLQSSTRSPPVWDLPPDSERRTHSWATYEKEAAPETVPSIHVTCACGKNYGHTDLHDCTFDTTFGTVTEHLFHPNI
ncbi:uncharacterized protein LOC129588604 [Paramacrobiotus metropolitanus]|uniref:uncharacterized protein LOC129588604 n=1 Tax=Paramacrobiotus metropolitanus TaxID=2943436 RepID=UPI0024456134|nr:uncharacterized protein LOC129588604 [Paramacrobiotus metropolitanus]